MIFWIISNYWILYMIKPMFIFWNWSSMSFINFVFLVLFLQPLWRVYLASDLCDSTKRNGWNPAQGPSCVDGIAFSVLQGLEKTTQEALAQRVLLLLVTTEIKGPKALHYQAEDRAANQLKGKGWNRHFLLLLTKGTEVAKLRKKPC